MASNCILYDFIHRHLPMLCTLWMLLFGSLLLILDNANSLLPSALTFFAAALLLVYSIARKVGLSKGTAFILLAAMPYFLFWLHYVPNLFYTNDLPGHITYIHHISKHWLRPYDYWGGENFHPPLYYYLAATIFSLFKSIHTLDPLTAVRILSLGFYMIFCIYGVRTLRNSVTREGLLYYIGVLLIVFWPVSMIMATRINNDIALYAAWATTFYYLVRWYKEQHSADLQLTLICMGITFMIKSNAVIPLAILYVSVVIGRVPWHQLLLRKSLMAFGVLGLGILVNSGKMIYAKFFYDRDVSNAHFGELGNNSPSLHHFIHFDVVQYVTHPFNLVWQEPAFLNNFLKTMLYGEFTWKHEDFASGLNILLLVFLIIILFTTVARFFLEKQFFTHSMPYLVATIIPLLALMGFFIIKRMTVCQDFRFVLPMLVPLVVLFVHGMEKIGSVKLLRPLYWSGIVVGISLPIGAAIFYMAQYL